MKRKFITNLALLLFLNLLIKPIYAFGIDVGVQNTVGAMVYGNYFILLNFSLIFQILLDLGIENFTRREIAQHGHLLNKYFSNILPLKGILGIAYFVLCSLIGYFFLGLKMHDFLLLLILLFNQFLASFVLYCRANLGGLHHFKVDSIISVIDRFIVIIICGLLLLNPVTRASFRIEWLVYAQSTAYLVASSISFMLVYTRANPIRIRIRLKYYLAFLRHSLPYALLILLMATYMRTDSVLLGKMLVNGKEQAGIYAQSFRIIEILSNYGYLFTILLLPLFSRMIRHHESVEHLTKLSFTLLFVPALIVAFGCQFYRLNIIHLLYNEHVERSARVFGILVFSFLGICMTYIFGTLLTANGSLKQLNIMAGFAVTLNLSLNVILIPRLGVVGAAITSLVTQTFTSVYQLLLAKKVFGFNINYPLVLRFSLFILLIATTGYIFHHLQVNWIYSFVIYLFTGLLLAIATGIFNLRALFSTLLSFPN